MLGFPIVPTSSVQSEPTGRRSASRVTVDIRTDFDERGGLVDEWRVLMAESGSRNPFLAPEWQIAWARHFTAPGELRLLTVRHGERLVALAPFYRRESGHGPLTIVRTRLLGRGSREAMTELPQVLCDPQWRRKALRAVVTTLTKAGTDSDWVEVTLGPDQVWLEPEWLHSSDTPWVTVHTGVVATVAMRLPETADELDRVLKRNVTESIRRSENRLRRADAVWEFNAVDEPGRELTEGVDQLIALHSARARVGDHLPHTDHFAEPGHLAFLREVVPAMAAAGHVQLCSLTVQGKPIASLLVLRAGGGAFFSASGMDPAWWECSPMTLLQRECLRHLILCGDRSVNLSRGPNAAKLRWAEELEVHHNFSLVAGRRRSQIAFTLYAPYRTAVEFWIRARNQRLRDPAAAESPSRPPLRARFRRDPDDISDR